MIRILHRVGFTSRLVTDLWVSSYLAFPSLPLRAVFFCCTVLKVAFTGISPAPLPYDARTFLTVFLPRDRPANSLNYNITICLLLQPIEFICIFALKRQKKSSQFDLILWFKLNMHFLAVILRCFACIFLPRLSFL